MKSDTVFTTQVGRHALTIATGKLAEQAGGAVTLRVGESVLLATATMSKNVREGLDFFPLSVDFEEKMYAAGRIPGGFFRREGKPTTDAVLTSRLTDRPLRPLFPVHIAARQRYHLGPLSGPAGPGGLTPNLHVTTSPVSTTGSIGVDGVLIGLGRRHAAATAVAFRRDDIVTVFINDQLIRTLTIDRARHYQPQRH